MVAVIPREVVATLVGNWDWSTVAGVGDPGDGNVRADTPATAIAIAGIDADGGNRLADLEALIVAGDDLLVQKRNDATQWLRYTITAAPIEHPPDVGPPVISAGPWVELALAYLSGSEVTQPRKGDPLYLRFGRSPIAVTGQAYATAQDLADALHLRLTTEKQPALDRALLAAASEIDQDLDRIDALVAPYPDAIVQTNIDRAVEWYKAADAAYGIIGTEDTGAIRAPRDGFARHAQNITAYKQRWGVG